MGGFDEILLRLRNNDENLIQLSLNEIDIRGTDMKALANALMKNTALQELHFDNSKMWDGGMVALGDALTGNTKSVNESSKIFANAIRRTSDLRWLLPHEAMRDERTAKLADSLLHCTALILLSVSTNETLEEDAVVLAYALLSNSIFRVSISQYPLLIGLDVRTWHGSSNTHQFHVEMDLVQPEEIFWLIKR